MAQPLAEVISAEEYMEKYAHDYYEWVDGKLVDLRPFTLRQLDIAAYLRTMVEAFLALKRIGQVVGIPFLLRLDTVNTRREPDLQIILSDNPGQLTDTAMIGPADIVIEVVSPESVARDHGEKYQEYEKAKVKEYWIADPIREECRFNRLNDKGLYVTVAPDADGYYETPLLPGLRIHVPTLWQDPLPDVIAIVEAVKKMLKAKN